MFVFRAEYLYDVGKLLTFSLSKAKWKMSVDYLKVERWEFEGKKYPDVTVFIDGEGMTLGKLKEMLKKVSDGHVMVETVATEEEYTGLRPSNL